jgi:demethylmenaquinone methyltransferase/2-methoxy-6-polyprenyl-1,4-benzoquinol methylase
MSGSTAAAKRGLDLLAVRPGERALEIGYGTGHALVMLAQAAGPSGRVAGIDISNSRIAEQRIGEARLGDRIELLTADVPPLPWAEATSMCWNRARALADASFKRMKAALALAGTLAASLEIK